MILDSLVSEAEVTILPNPKIEATSADYEEQQQVLGQIEGTIKSIHESVNQMRSAKLQLAGYAKLLKDNEKAKELLEIGTALTERIDRWEENLIQPKQKTFQDVINFNNKLNAQLMELKSYVDVAEPKVTQGAKERLRDLLAQWEGFRTERNAIVDKEMKDYNDAFKKLGLPALILQED